MAARTTGNALIDFWQTPFVENRVSSRMAADMATACREVLGAQANVSNVNLRTCPANELADQFIRAHPDRPRATLAAYKSRFKKAVRLYLEYLDDPNDWPREKQPSKVDRSASNVSLQSYNFPLREGVIAPLLLPLDITRGEAVRLAAFIESLVISE